MASIHGQWKWKYPIKCFVPSNMSSDPNIQTWYYKISFKSGATNWSGFFVSNQGSTHSFGYYINQSSAGRNTICSHQGRHSSNLWYINSASSYAKIDFGPDPQSMPDEFYNYFVQYAEYIPDISDYLETIAINEPKVYNAGYQKGYQEGLDSFVDTFCNSDSLIPVLYAEYVDVQSTSTNNSESTNKHLIGPVYGLNNENERVPILYHIDYTDMGVDKYYYVGQDTKEGTLYDKWRKIEPGKGFGWDSLQKIYVYTAPVITSEEL